MALGKQRKSGLRSTKPPPSLKMTSLPFPFVIREVARCWSPQCHRERLTRLDRDPSQKAEAMLCYGAACTLVSPLDDDRHRHRRKRLKLPGSSRNESSGKPALAGRMMFHVPGKKSLAGSNVVEALRHSVAQRRPGLVLRPSTEAPQQRHGTCRLGKYLVLGGNSHSERAGLVRH